MKKIDIICDLETLGTKTTSPIIQIAAIACDIASRTILDRFNVFIDVSKDSSEIDVGTIKWWLDTNPDLLTDILSKGNKKEKIAIKEFTEWLEKVRFTYAQREKDKKCELLFWGNGILFDNCLIRAACERNGFEYPIKFWNDRDLRTLLMLASLKSGVSEKTIKDRAVDKNLEAHDAMNDCENELKIAYACYEILM